MRDMFLRAIRGRVLGVAHFLDTDLCLVHALCVPTFVFLGGPLLDALFPQHETGFTSSAHKFTTISRVGTRHFTMNTVACILRTISSTAQKSTRWSRFFG